MTMRLMDDEKRKEMMRIMEDDEFGDDVEIETRNDDDNSR